MRPCAVTLAVLGLMAAGCGGDRVAAPCGELPGRAVEIMEERGHVPHVDAEHAPYLSSPATSGPHLAFTVTPGAYRDALAEDIQVHALEHGHVVLQYGPGVRRHAAESVARRFPRDVLVAPRDEPGVVLSAWGRLERLPDYDEARVDRFVELLAGRYDHGWQDGATACAG